MFQIVSCYKEINRVLIELMHNYIATKNSHNPEGKKVTVSFSFTKVDFTKLLQVIKGLREKRKTRLLKSGKQNIKKLVICF